ncbi:acyltransferase family protein [Colwellia echini]|uniref:Acyltransferase n=1 Tax=Colwellia echini TaxID=1982103 RepID=A0ABY3MU43_9GAMM|nr:acyltransferase [Colwellia echini]TYK64723.1 acyltransferase [Colwellia echini]
MFPNWVVSHENNLNFIRFILSSLVLFTHCFALYYGGSKFEPFHEYGFTLGSLAVDVFFILSGFLIAKSVFFSKDLISYFFARVLRIIPALIVVLILTVFILGPIFTILPIDAYFYNFDTWSYLVRNTLLIFGINFTLPGVFESVPFQKSVNGSLWTLQYEVRLYALLFVFFITYEMFKNYNVRINKLNSYRLMFSCFFIIANYLYLMSELQRMEYSKGYYLTFLFSLGSLLFIWSGISNAKYIFCFFILSVISLNALVLKTFFPVVFLPVILFGIYLFGYVINVKLGKDYFKNNDISYGLYIYAFPVQQSLISISSDIGFILYILLSFLLTVILAYASWIFIEKPFTLYKKQVVYFFKFFSFTRLRGK